MSDQTFRALPVAEDEANDAFDWYQSEQLGVGDKFRAEVKLALERIASNPLQFPIIHGSNIRRTRLNRFPFSIIYRVEDDLILIVAIFHESRNPIIWRGRID